MRPALLFSAGLLTLTMFVAGWREARCPQPVGLLPRLTGETEYCLTCHADLPEISSSHPVETFGCVSCHGGERLALDPDLAHSTLRGGRNPSDLAVVTASCGGGACHSGAAADHRDHIQRVKTSVQATYSGALATVLYAFGAQSSPEAQFGVFDIFDSQTSTGLPGLSAFDPAIFPHPPVQDFAANCLTCHLSADYLPGEAYARFTGCAACHSLTAGVASEGPVHQLTTAIPYTQCNACHNRGNFDLRTMTFVPRDDHPANRLEGYYQPIAQFTRCEYTLDCIDCHTRTEAMGDGDIHSNQADIQYVQCRTCHGTLTELPRTRTLTDLNDLAFRLAALNPVIDLQIGDSVLVTETGEPLWNTRQLPDGTFELFGKATGQRFVFRPTMGTGCQQKPDEQESRYCHACHAIEVER